MMSKAHSLIIEFIQERFFNVFDFELNENTLIEDDLGITGLDAVELIVDFGKRFNVDVSNFKAADYFGAEGESIFSFDSSPRRKLNIGHLAKAVHAGKLDEEIIG